MKKQLGSRRNLNFHYSQTRTEIGWPAAWACLFCLLLTINTDNSSVRRQSVHPHTHTQQCEGRKLMFDQNTASETPVSGRERRRWDWCFPCNEPTLIYRLRFTLLYWIDLVVRITSCMVYLLVIYYMCGSVLVATVYQQKLFCFYPHKYLVFTKNPFLFLPPSKMLHCDLFVLHYLVFFPQCLQLCARSRQWLNFLVRHSYNIINRK